MIRPKDSFVQKNSCTLDNRKSNSLLELGVKPPVHVPVTSEAPTGRYVHIYFCSHFCIALLGLNRNKNPDTGGYHHRLLY